MSMCADWVGFNLTVDFDKPIRAAEKKNLLDFEYDTDGRMVENFVILNDGTSVSRQP